MSIVHFVHSSQISKLLVCSLLTGGMAGLQQMMQGAMGGAGGNAGAGEFLSMTGESKGETENLTGDIDLLSLTSSFTFSRRNAGYEPDGRDDEAVRNGRRSEIIHSLFSSLAFYFFSCLLYQCRAMQFQLDNSINSSLA